MELKFLYIYYFILLSLLFCVTLCALIRAVDFSTSMYFPFTFIEKCICISQNVVVEKAIIGFMVNKVCAQQIIIMLQTGITLKHCRLF